MEAGLQELYLDMVGLNLMSGSRTILSLCTHNLSQVGVYEFDMELVRSRQGISSVAVVSEDRCSITDNSSVIF